MRLSLDAWPTGRASRRARLLVLAMAVAALAATVVAIAPATGPATARSTAPSTAPATAPEVGPTRLVSTGAHLGGAAEIGITSLARPRWTAGPALVG